VEVSNPNFPMMYLDLLWKIRTPFMTVEENSRNGPVISFKDPVLFRVYDPTQRMITCPIRDANPFFHIMEFVWMMAGSNDIKWISYFNSRMMEFSDDGATQSAAYGYRWRKHFGVDQVMTVINMLTTDPTTRRAVISMWAPAADLYSNPIYGKDRPCNTTLMFRVLDGQLNMTVTNRSNDLIWGAMGANAVHMSMLQELIAEAIGLNVGEYIVLSNNLHMYKDMPRFEEIWNTTGGHSVYGHASPRRILLKSETYEDFVKDCEDLVDGKTAGFSTRWMKEVGLPVYSAYTTRKEKVGGEDSWVARIQADDIREACELWLARRNK